MIVQMDYAKHYSLLISRAVGQTLEGYTEKHHILPRCMGGTDDPENLVRLTAREHFVAHQLLVKMHPEVSKLVFALRMLSAANYGRQGSRLHTWLRHKMSMTAAENMRNRNQSNPEILHRARANFTDKSRVKQQASFAATMAMPGVRERRSEKAKRRWMSDIKNRELVGRLAKERAEKLNGQPIGRNTSCPVAQMLPNGFVVVEHTTVKAAAAFAGINRCTVRERVARNHPLWGYAK